MRFIVLCQLVAVAFAYLSARDELFYILKTTSDCTAANTPAILCRNDAIEKNIVLESSHAFMGETFDIIYTYTSYISTPAQIEAVYAYLAAHGLMQQ
jgi:hypothetical protein